MLHLLLLLMMMVKVVTMQLSADIYPCSDETKTGILHFAENTSVQICCQLSEKYCKATTSNDTLTLLPEHETGCNGSCDSHIHRDDICIVKFEISNASATDGGKYFCKLNGEKLMTAEVIIIKKPQTPVITSFSCSLKNERTVTFDRGPTTSEYNDSYNVTMIELINNYVNTYVMCNTSQTVCRPGDRICTCNLTVPGTIYYSHNVTICVTVVRSVQTSETSKNFSIAANIIPAPVKRLKSSDVRPNSASIQFCMDVSTSNVCGFMALDNASLRFNLQLSKKQGTPEFLNVTLLSSAITNFICEFKCMLVKLTNLTAFTNYTVLVSSCGGGGESQKSELTFTTAQTAPVYPPLVDAIGFRRLKSYNVSGLLLPGLVLMWKPLPHEAVGARELSYHIKITSENGFQDNQTTADIYAVVLHKDFPPGPVTIKLWSQNVLGRSQNYTTFDIPPQSEIAAPYVLVELNGDSAFVYVNLTLHTSVPLIVQWCNSTKDQTKNDFRVCQDYPSNTTFTLKADATETFQTLAVNISENTESKRIQDYKLIKYYPIKRLNMLPGTEQTANATVIIGDRNLTQEVKNNDYYVEEKNTYDDDLYYYDMNNDSSRIRRQVQEDGSYGQEKLFFISFEKESSQYNTGMIAANCYYDATKDKVNLIVSQSQDGDSDNVILRWSQECSPEVPGQFLADHFLVYSSTDEHCTNPVLLDGVSNALFQPNLLKISSGIQFACIKTVGRNGALTGPQTVPINDYNTGKNTSLPVVGYVLGPIAGIVILACLIYFVRKLKQHIHRMPCGLHLVLPVKNTSNEYILEVICGSASSVPEQTVSRDEISNSSSNDSGRGTDNESKHVIISDRTNKDIRESSTGSAVTPSCSNHILQCTSDVPGSSPGVVTPEIDCSTSYHEENEKTDIDDFRIDGSSRSQESNTESRQREAFKEKGWTFNANASSDSSSSQISTVSSVHTHSDGSYSGGNSERRVISDSSCSCNSVGEENSNCHSDGSDSEQSGGHSERRVISGSSCSVTEESCNCDSEEENSSCSKSGRECGQPQDASLCSNSESGNCKSFGRLLSSGSESEGDSDRPLLPILV